LNSARTLAEQWTAERLAEQSGALVSSRLDGLIEILRLRSLGIDTAAPVAPAPPGSLPLIVRLASRLGAEETTKHPTPSWVELQEDATVLLRSGEARAPLYCVELTADALAACRKRVLPLCPEDLPVEPDTRELARILKPPSRLLSELTSKRLLRCFGLDSASELLCRSPSEASRAAEQLGGDVVLKLVRPELDHKQAKGLVASDAVGPSAIRKVTADLLARGDELGPPASLGVLVCSRVDGGCRLWLQLDRHPRLGRILLGGPGDIPTASPLLALSIPFDAKAAWQALHLAPISGSLAERTAMTRALSALSRAIESLGDSISRLEIHPLVARDDLPGALLLDGLVRLEIEARRDRPRRL
jgi:hypothetical protein